MSAEETEVKPAIREIFLKALELPPADREAYLARACGTDSGLRSRIDALLKSTEDDSFLERPAAQVSSTVVITPGISEGPGTVIDKYKLLEKLGEGGFGVVYMAEQKQPVKRRVALKIIKVGMDTREVVARFEAERQALAVMDHPNIAKIFDAGATQSPTALGAPASLPARSQPPEPAGKDARAPDDAHPLPSDSPPRSALAEQGGRGIKGEGSSDSSLVTRHSPLVTYSGRPYFVMELVRGVKITDYCDEKNLSTQERLNLFMQVCQAVQHAHQKGIIHRDLKPSNILVTVNDGIAIPKVIDFGIAKATQMELTEKTVFTRFQQFIGTPAYMSPEQAEITSVDIDTRSDIYSLGVLLYELLTGKTPFDAKELLLAGLDEMRRTLREKEPERPSTRVSTLGGEELTTTAKRRGLDAPKLVNLLRGDLDWIVMKCLEKDRARRYETANGLASDIERHLNNEPVVACPPSAVYRFQKMVRRNKLAFAAVAGVSTALVLGLCVATWGLLRERAARNRAVAAEKEQALLRQQAQTEAAKSDQVAQFLKDMLQGVGPSVALGRDTTLLREILEKTAQEVRKDLKTQPLIQAELLSIIGRVYFELDDFEEAEKLHRAALDLRRKVLGTEHADVAASLNDLGFAILRENKFAEAEPLIREALAMREKLFGEEHLDVAASLATLAGALPRNSQAEEEMRTRVVAIRRKLLGEHPEVAKAIPDLALCLAGRGNVVAAERLSREGLEMQKKFFGDLHPAVAESLRYLSGILLIAGRWDEAESVCRQALEIKEKLNGAQSWTYGITLRQLAELHERQGRLGEAESAYRNALILFRKLAEHGGANPENRLAETLMSLGRLLQRDGKRSAAEEVFREALPITRKAAERGYPGAQNSLGVMYVEGKVVPKDEAEGIRWYRKAAEEGEACARFNLGFAFARGIAVAKDATEAVKWYRLAADQGFAQAQHYLGWMYQHGEGVAKDDAEAVNWYRKAAEQGFSEAQNNLGRRYASGEGVARDPVEAVAWYRKAAIQGHAIGQANLAGMYQRGEGVTQDPVEAVKWYRKAANQGDAVAQASLAKMYCNGEGVAKDLTEALQWFRKAAESEETEPLNDIAWFLAVCADPKIRDGRSAVSYAKKAVAATNRKEPGILDTLAAAYAEIGEFEKSVATQKEAISINKDEALKGELASRLKLYESGSPYREHE